MYQAILIEITPMIGNKQACYSTHTCGYVFVI